MANTNLLTGCFFKIPYTFRFFCFFFLSFNHLILRYLFTFFHLANILKESCSSLLTFLWCPHPSILLFLLCIDSFFKKHFSIVAVIIVYFPGGVSGEESGCQSRRLKGRRSIPGLGRSPEVGNGNPLQYSCLRNPMESGAWWVAAHGVSK